MTPGAAKLLARMIEARLAFLISGGTGTGKHTRVAAHRLGRPCQELHLCNGPRRNGGSAVARKWLVLQFPVRYIRFATEADIKQAAGSWTALL